MGDKSAFQKYGAAAWTVYDPRIQPCPTTGCWLWMGSGTTGGYGRAHINGRASGSHRIFWSMVNGTIPKGMHMDHICRTPACVNPDHLRPVTPGENATRNSASPTAINAQKTACPRCGGPFSPLRGGGRHCARCTRAYNVKRYHNLTPEQKAANLAANRRLRRAKRAATLDRLREGA